MTARVIAGWAVVGLAFMNSIFWQDRLAAFRKDRRWERSTFGESFDLNWEVLNRSNYSAEGRTTYLIFVISIVVFWAALAVAAYWTWR